MAVEAKRLPFEKLAEAAAGIAAESELRGALQALAEATADAVGADLVVLRVLETDGTLVARAVAPEGSALAAEVAGSRAAAAADGVAASAPTLRAAERARAFGVFAAPARAAGRVVGAVEIVRVARLPNADERTAVELAAGQLALAVRTLGSDGQPAAAARARWLELAGEALAAGADPVRTPHQALRIGAETAGARAGLLWAMGGDGELELLAAHEPPEAGLEGAREAALEALQAWRPVSLSEEPALAGSPVIATMPLGQPPFAVLQLLYGDEAAPRADELPFLAAYAVRAGDALRAAEQAREQAVELERTRALVEVVGEAISQLSLAHTLETSVERIAELLQIEQVGVYLLEEGRLVPAAGRGLPDGQERIAQELLELALGPLRARSVVHARTNDTEPALAPVRAALAASGLRAALGVALHVREEPIGLLVAYPDDAGPPEGALALLGSLAAQLAVAVQNARLHERATELGEALGGVLASERQAARQLRALYEISHSFARSLSLETTLEAVTKTIVEALDVDAAVLRVPDERGEAFVPRAVHVADSRLAAAVRTILERPQPGPVRLREQAMLDAETALALGGADSLLVPFLEKGSTAALLPVATQTELLAQLTILSLDPAAPIDADTLATAATIAQQAALAIDNARLYQQQKAFAETMQQSLLPRKRPAMPGFEVGMVYESAAQVEVGGDVFDFVHLPDDRLAVVLGDVTGHGIDATADMAMAKFVFRSLAREHPEPADFLAHANDVVASEIALGKFITMAYLALDSRGEVLCASAGHPMPRFVHVDASVDALECGGLALGIEPGQQYEQVRARLEPGEAIVLYTDGVVESRREGELFGIERLDALLAERAALSAQQLANDVVAACRAYAGGELSDDCAIVVIKRT